MKLDFSVILPEALYAQLIEDCQRCEVSPKQYAAEALESVIASRRLPKVGAGTHGPLMRGTRAVAEEKELRLTEHKILI